MRLSFQEIRNRAIEFGHNWKDETSERAEAQTFWNEFFDVFKINRRSAPVAANPAPNPLQEIAQPRLPLSSNRFLPHNRTGAHP